MCGFSSTSRLAAAVQIAELRQRELEEATVAVAKGTKKKPRDSNESLEG